MVSLRLHRRVHASVKRRLGRRGGKADLEDDPGSPRGDADDRGLLTLSAVAVVLTGGLAKKVGKLIGVEAAA